MIIASFTLLLLIGGLGWFAFNYGQMAAQRDHLELQLAQYKTDKNVVSKPANVKSQEQFLQEKQDRTVCVWQRQMMPLRLQKEPIH